MKRARFTSNASFVCPIGSLKMAISCHFIDLLNEYSLHIVEQRINSEVKIIVLLKPMNNQLGVSPSKGKQGTTRGKEKIF